jgi:uncharacterized protein (DUF1697 family)
VDGSQGVRTAPQLNRAMKSAYVALLRGVNVGSANRLPMERLRALFVEAGASDVETLMRSGNVVFAATDANAAKIIGAVAGAINREFGFAAPMALRGSAALRALIDDNPFVGRGVDPDTLHALCLTETPSAASLARLDPNRSPPDEFLVSGQDVYLRLPSGVARTRLTNAWFDSRLGVVSTLRNWRTILKLGELIAARGLRS